MNYHNYNAAWGELKRARRTNDYQLIAKAANQLLIEVADIVMQKEQEQEALRKRCNHPRVNADAICEVCGTILDPA